MIFSLDLRRARKGDCFLLHFGSKEKPGLALVDGGPRGVYAPQLRPRLEGIKAARGLGEKESLDLDLLMVSHVDDDHIQGILDLTKEMAEAHAAAQPQIVRVLSFWHNGFDEIIDNDAAELLAAIRSQFGPASTSGELPEDATVDADDEDLDEEAIVASLKVLASIEQGSRLRGEAEKLGFPRNPEFDGGLVVAGDAQGRVDVCPDLQLFVIGPMLPEIANLQQKHRAWLIERANKGRPASGALAAYVDKSVPNLSSIVVLAESGGKRMLLTGDARGDKILKGLELTGVLEKGARMHVDLLKVPHHGSANNLERDFFERITADHYVFSGDGEHGNPERETLRLLLDARGDADYAVHLTYPVDVIDAARQADWEKERQKEQRKRKQGPQRKVRGTWSPREHGLMAFMDCNPSFARKVRVVEEGKPHVIDLGESLHEAWPRLAAERES